MGRKTKKVEFTGFDKLPHWSQERDEDVLKKTTKIIKKPLTENHKKYKNSIEQSQVTFVVGPAGTLKTYLASEVACEMLKNKKIDKIVLCRPLITAGEELGILPGDLIEKVSPYLAPLINNICEIVGNDLYKKWEQEGKIEIEPLAIMRGKTFHNCFVILDESQNATYVQLQLFLTRIGQNCKMVINGDVEQSDLKTDYCPLLDVWKRLFSPPRDKDVAFCMMNENDIVRSEIVKFFTKRLAKNYNGHIKTEETAEKHEENLNNNLRFYKGKK